MKKKMILVLVILAIIAVVILISLYISDKSFRDWVGKYFLNKEIVEEELPTINLNADKQNQVHVYSKYIALLNDKTLNLYNKFGEEVGKIEVDISKAIFDSEGKYLVVAEKNGKNFCLVLEKTYLWSNSIEGEIIQVCVNSNGYVAIITTDSTNKSILTVYNSTGKKLFKSYFASTRIIDVSISKDNKYIAIGEIDTSGSIIQSNIKIISMENAQNNSEDAIIFTHNAESGSLVTNVEYQENGQIACMYDNSINVIKDKKSEEILKIEDDSITFMTVKLKNNIAFIKEESSGIFKSNSNIEMINTNSGEKNITTVDDIAKEIKSKDEVLSVNFGTEMYFYDTNLWLIKKYTAKQEITNVDFSNSMAAVIYRDKIVIINF